MKLAQFEDAFAAFCLRGPCERQQLGATDNIGEFSSVTKESAQHAISWARSLLSDLESVVPEEAQIAAFRVDKALYQLYLQRFLLDNELRYNGLTNAEQMPIAAERIGDSIFTLLINDNREPTERAADLISRIASIPSFLEQCTARLTRPVTRWTSVERQAAEGLPGLFETALRFIEESAPTLQLSFKEHEADARSAIAAYIQYLDTVQTEDNFMVGPEAAEAIIRARGIMLPLPELKKIASSFLASTRTEIERLRIELAKKHGYSDDIDAATLQEKLAAAHPVMVPNGLEDVLERYRAEEKKVMTFIHNTQLFPIPDEQSLEIMRTPNFLAPTIPAGAMLPPPPLRAGTKKSLVYLTLSDALLAEHNELSIPIMMVHEGIPGHHLQLSWAASHPKLIRRVYDAMDLAEGWTTMLEDYMLDQGYAGELTAEVRFMAKREICRLAARVGIDLYFMTGDASYLELDGFVPPPSDDPFVRAGKLLQSVTGFVEARVQAELNWYSRERGYPLSYLTGNHLIWALKRDFEARHGTGQRTDRLFHERVLSSGNIPVHLLRAEFVQNDLLNPSKLP